MVREYLDKYWCRNCKRNYWCLSNPNECPHCGGRTRLVQQGTTPTDAPGEMAVRKKLSGEFDWTAFNEWWDEINAREG